MSAKIKKRYHNHTSHHTKPRGVSLRAFERTYWPYLPVGLLALLGVSIISHGSLHTAAQQPFATLIVVAVAVLSVV